MSSNIAALILMGGQNKRMNGQHKAFLTIQNESFLEHIKSKLACFSTIYLSVDDKLKFSQLGEPMIQDDHPSIGPMGGIYTALKQIPEAYLFVTACDMPYITEEFALYMISHFPLDATCFVLTDEEHFFYPLGAVYSKAALPYLERFIAQKHYSLKQLIMQSPAKTMALADTPFSKEIFTNINTPHDYAAYVKCSNNSTNLK